MATTPQIVANRANAQLSTGPRTPAGIEAARFNATRHGLTSTQIVIKGEDPAAYDALRAELVAAYSPAGEVEAMLVEQVAQHWWRLERARRIEARMMQEFGEIEAYTNKAYLNLQRQMLATERAWNRSVSELERIGSNRAALQREQMLAGLKRSPIGSDFAFADRPAGQLSVDELLERAEQLLKSQDEAKSAAQLA